MECSSRNYRIRNRRGVVWSGRPTMTNRDKNRFPTHHSTKANHFHHGMRIRDGGAQEKGRHGTMTSRHGFLSHRQAKILPDGAWAALKVEIPDGVSSRTSTPEMLRHSMQIWVHDPFPSQDCKTRRRPSLDSWKRRCQLQHRTPLTRVDIPVFCSCICPSPPCICPSQAVKQQFEFSTFLTPGSESKPMTTSPQGP